MCVFFCVLMCVCCACVLQIKALEDEGEVAEDKAAGIDVAEAVRRWGRVCL